MTWGSDFEDCDLKIELDDAGPADVVVRAEPQLLLGLLTGLLPAADARAQGVSIEGDAAALADLPSQFQFDSPSRENQGANP